MISGCWISRIMSRAAQKDDEQSAANTPICPPCVPASRAGTDPCVSLGLISSSHPRKLHPERRKGAKHTEPFPLAASPEMFS